MTAPRFVLPALLWIAFGLFGCQPEPGRPHSTDGPPPTDGQAGAGLVVDGTPGLWHPARDTGAALTDVQREELERLGSLPYVGGSRPASADAGSGVVHFAEGEAYEGLNLVVSGHGPEATLLDMQGTVLHRWRFAYADIQPRQPPTESVMEHFWRRAYVYPNGDLLAIFENIGLLKIDRDSKQLWYYGGKAHHDLEIALDGRIYVLTQRPRQLGERRVIDNDITILDADGKEMRSVSILKSFFDSDYRAAVLQMMESPTPDLLHTNTLEVLDGSLADTLPGFRKGNILIGSPYQRFVAVVDLERETAVWAMFNLWRGQHDPTVLPNGNMLVFDNYGTDSTSRVLEVDPLTQAIAWRYEGSDAAPFFSQTGGLAQRLPNGNTLITETNAGRAFEVNRDGGIVWEYLNPHRAGEAGELIASLFQATRLAPDRVVFNPM